MDQFDLPKAQTKRGGGGNRGRGRHSSSAHRGPREEGGSHLESNDYRYEDSDEDSDVDSQPQQQQQQQQAAQQRHLNQGKKPAAGTDQGPAPSPAIRAAAQRRSRGADFAVLLQEADLQYSQSYHRHVEFLSDDLLPLPADLLPFLSTKDPDQELELDLPALAASLAHLPLSTLIRCHPQYVTSELATSVSFSTGDQGYPTQQAVMSSVTSQQGQQDSYKISAPPPLSPSQLPHAPSSTAPSPSAPETSQPEETQAPASQAPAHPIQDRPGVATSHVTRMQAHASMLDSEKVSNATSSAHAMNTAAASAATGSSSVATVAGQDPLSADEDEGTEELLNLLGCGVVPTPTIADSERTRTSADALQSRRSGSSSCGVPIRTAGLPARSSSSSYTPALASAGSAAAPPPSAQLPSAVKQSMPSTPLSAKPAGVNHLSSHVATSSSVKPQQPAASTLQPQQRQSLSTAPPMSLSSSVLPRQPHQPTPMLRAQQSQMQQQQQPSIVSPPSQRHVDLELEALLGMGTVQAPFQRQSSSTTPVYSATSGSGKSMVTPVSSGASHSLPVTNPQPMQASLRPVPATGSSYASNSALRNTSTALATPAASKGTVKIVAAPTPNLDDWLDSM